MKLSTKFILFVAIIHLVTLTLTWFVFDKNKLLFIGAEVFILLSIGFAISLYKQLIKPLAYLMQGIEAIKDRDFNVKFSPTGRYEIDQLVGVYNLMMDELRKERTTQEQQHFFLEKLIQTSPTGILILDYDNKIEQLNPKASEILSVTAKEVVGQQLSALPQKLFKKIEALRPNTALVVKPDGINTFKLQKAHFVDRGFTRQFVMIEQLTAEIQAAERNVYGKVIRMMAHEVNNTIGPVNSILQSALAAHPLWASHKYNNLKDALQVALDRNQNLNLFMRNFADLVKLPAARQQSIDLYKIVQSVGQLMAVHAREKNIDFSFHLPGDQFIIYADAQLLEQALINIVKNSMEAIDAHGSIVFSISGRILEITDSGKGISMEDNDELFSPFFSTKKDGQGIGLTLVREILINHGFEFSLKTLAPGHTVFSVKF